MMPRLNGSTPADRKSDGDTEKVSALPSDEIISAKMLELIGIGVKRDEAVKLIRQIAGFEAVGRSEEHTSELQSLMRSSYAVFCLKKKIQLKIIMNKTINYE